MRIQNIQKQMVQYSRFQLTSNQTSGVFVWTLGIKSNILWLHLSKCYKVDSISGKEAIK